jgi:hypothetical protein
MAEDLQKLVREFESGKPSTPVSWKRAVPAAKPVATAKAAKPKAAGKPKLEKVKLPAPFGDLWQTTHAVGSLIVLGNMDPPITGIVDIASWPPKVTIERDVYPFSISSRGTRWLAVGHGKAGQYRAWLFDGKKRIADLPPFTDKCHQGLKRGTPFGDGAVVWGQGGEYPIEVPARERIARWWDGKKYHPLPELKLGKDGDADFIQLETVVLGNGSELLVFNGNAYERKGARFVKVLALGIDDFYDWSHVLAGDDGLIYKNDRDVYEAHLGGKPKARVRDLNIMDFGPGPGGSIVCKQGDNKTRDTGLLWFPADDRRVRIKRDLGVADTEMMRCHGDRLVSVHKGGVVRSLVLTALL